MLPHLRVHRGGEHERSRAREHGGAEQVVGDAGREPSERVGRCGCDHDHVGGLAERDMAHLGDALVQVGADRIPADRLERGQPHEAQSRLRRYDVDVVPGQHEEAYKADGLVRRDAAGDPDDDAQSIAGSHPRLRGRGRRACPR
ncbi:hypothetical protein GCM10025866_28880 [Naasia aerilata]|uniref:Uncharacterized protein n=1 Tax=Naasia aerilata TaxID=1162966 RepID=A0ABM8GF87_9MICO|nr:hypothetical protein GCM10025866_28880 [Naasia aerilata]